MLQPVRLELTDSDSSSSSSGNTFLVVCQAANSRAITLPVLAASPWALARIDTDGEPLVIGRRGPVAIAFPATAGIGWSKVCGSACGASLACEAQANRPSQQPGMCTV